MSEPLRKRLELAANAHKANATLAPESRREMHLYTEALLREALAALPEDPPPSVCPYCKHDSANHATADGCQDCECTLKYHPATVA